MVSLEDDLQHFWVFQGFPPGSRNQDSRRCLCSRHLQRPRPRCEQPWLLRGAPRALEGPWDKPLLSSQKRGGIQQIIADPFPSNQAFSGGPPRLGTLIPSARTIPHCFRPRLTKCPSLGEVRSRGTPRPPMFGICPNGKIHLEMWDVRLPYLITRWCMYVYIYMYILWLRAQIGRWSMHIICAYYMCIYTHLLVLVSKRVRLFDFWFCRSHTLHIWSHHSFYDFLPESAENIHNKAWDHSSSCGDEVCTCRLSDMEMGQNLYQLPALTQAHINPFKCISLYIMIQWYLPKT